MEIDQEIAVRAILVLANTRLGERSSAKQREAAIPERDNFGQRGFARTPVLSVGIYDWTMDVMCEFDAAAFEIGEAVEHVAVVEIGPAGHGTRREALVAGRRREKEDLLPGGDDPLADHVGEKLREPRTAGEDEAVGSDAIAIAERDCGKRFAGRRNRALHIGSTIAEELFD